MSNEQVHAYNLSPGDVVLLEGNRETVKELHNVPGACWIITTRPTYRYRIPDEDMVIRVDHKP
jgi:hypothetical protein